MAGVEDVSNSTSSEAQPGSSASLKDGETAAQVDDQVVATHGPEHSLIDKHPPHPHPDSAQSPARPDLSVVRLIREADHSAGKLVNLLAKHFECFRDEARFEGQKVRFLKRAQIFVADLWAAFNGTGYGEFHDIGHLTMFAGKEI